MKIRINLRGIYLKDKKCIWYWCCADCCCKINGSDYRCRSYVCCISLLLH